MKVNKVFQRAARKSPLEFKEFVEGVRRDCRDADIDEGQVCPLVYKHFAEIDEILSKRYEIIKKVAMCVGGATMLTSPVVSVAFGRNFLGSLPYMIPQFGVGMALTTYVPNHLPLIFYTGPSLESIRTKAEINRELTQNPEQYEVMTKFFGQRELSRMERKIL